VERHDALTADGVRLALARWPAAGERRGVLLCTHAMMADARYFSRDFAPFLARRGLEVFTLDWRGHGDSVPPSPRADRWQFEDYVQLDLPAAMAAVCRIADVAPSDIAYLGHSLGGLVGLAAFGTRAAPLPGRLTLWATSVWLPGPGGSRRRRALMRLFSLAARPRGYAPARLLRVGSNDEPRAYVDQLAGWAHTGAWTAPGGFDYRDRLPSVAAPVWGVCGARDRLCSPGDAAALLDPLPGARPLRIVGPSFGDPCSPDHFGLFTDSRLAGLWTELVDFAASAAR